MCSGENIVIASNIYPMSIVKSRFCKLNYQHIVYVLERLQNNTSGVKNIKKYLLTMLFNAPSTMENYYLAEVNHNRENTVWFDSFARVKRNFIIRVRQTYYLCNQTTGERSSGCVGRNISTWAFVKHLLLLSWWLVRETTGQCMMSEEMKRNGYSRNLSVERKVSE